MFVKVCGLRASADVTAAVEAGADALGFVFAESVRKIGAGEVRALLADVPSSVLTVGVFKDQSAAEVAALADEAGVDAVQLHGSYERAVFDALAGRRLIRATTLTPDTDVRVGAYGEELLLLDSPVAGSGDPWDLSVLEQGRPVGPWLLAGGLDPDNVGAAIESARPWGVDVSSGVESSRGVKDAGRIRAFVAAAREGFQRVQ